MSSEVRGNESWSKISALQKSLYRDIIVIVSNVSLIQLYCELLFETLLCCYCCLGLTHTHTHTHLVKHILKLLVRHTAEPPQQLRINNQPGCQSRHVTSRHVTSRHNTVTVVNVLLMFTHCLVVQPELLLRHEADMEAVVLQEQVVSRETVTGVKLSCVVWRHHGSSRRSNLSKTPEGKRSVTSYTAASETNKQINNNNTSSSSSSSSSSSAAAAAAAADSSSSFNWRLENNKLAPYRHHLVWSVANTSKTNTLLE